MPTLTPRDPDFEARVREGFARQAYMATIGAEILRIAPGEIDLGLAFRADLTQQHGYLHAGVVTALVDSACGFAAFTLMPAGSGVVSVEFKVNLLAPSVGERMIARGRVLRPGRTLTACSGEVVAVTGGEETPVVAMLATMMRIDKV